MEPGERRCDLCKELTSSNWNVGRILSCLNLLFVLAVTIYVAELHREVVGLRTELGRYSKSAVAQSRHTGNGQVDVRGFETDLAEENELLYRNGYVSLQEETTVDAVQQNRSRRDVQQRAKVRAAKKNKKRHRKRGVKAVHLEAKLPRHGAIREREDRVFDYGDATRNGYSPPDVEGDMKFRYWHAPQWTKAFSSMFQYHHETGQTTVKEPGLYFVYSQITLSSDSIRSGYSIYVDNIARFTCVRQQSATSTGFLTNTCSTSGVVVLKRGQKISIGVESEDLRSLMDPRLCFWGMIKLANFRI